MLLHALLEQSLNDDCLQQGNSNKMPQVLSLEGEECEVKKKTCHDSPPHYLLLLPRLQDEELYRKEQLRLWPE
jgi:hypothetical protein